jgi:hypothetical protein
MQPVTSPKKSLTSPKHPLFSPQHPVTSPKWQVTSPKQSVTLTKQSVALTKQPVTTLKPTGASVEHPVTLASQLLSSAMVIVEDQQKQNLLNSDHLPVISVQLPDTKVHDPFLSVERTVISIEQPVSTGTVWHQVSSTESAVQEYQQKLTSDKLSSNSMKPLGMSCQLPVTSLNKPLTSVKQPMNRVPQQLISVGNHVTSGQYPGSSVMQSMTSVMQPGAYVKQPVNLFPNQMTSSKSGLQDLQQQKVPADQSLLHSVDQSEQQVTSAKQQQTTVKQATTSIEPSVTTACHKKTPRVQEHMPANLVLQLGRSGQLTDMSAQYPLTSVNEPLASVKQSLNSVPQLVISDRTPLTSFRQPVISSHHFLQPSFVSQTPIFYQIPFSSIANHNFMFPVLGSVSSQPITPQIAASSYLLPANYQHAVPITCASSLED